MPTPTPLIAQAFAPLSSSTYLAPMFTSVLTPVYIILRTDSSCTKVYLATLLTTLTLCSYDTVSSPLSSIIAAFSDVLTEQVPVQYQLTGRDVMLVLHVSVTDEPKCASVSRGEMTITASLIIIISSSSSSTRAGETRSVNM